MAYDMRYPFIITTLVDEYAGAVEDCWGNRAETGVYLLSNLLKVSLHMSAQFQRDSFENCSDDKYIVSCDWTKEIFIKYSDAALIKRVEEKYEALNGIVQGGIAYFNIALDDMLNMSYVVITSLQ